ATSRANTNETALGLRIEYPARGMELVLFRMQSLEQIRWLEAMLDAARRLKQRNAEGRALANLSFSHNIIGQYRRAIELQEQALAMFREIGNRRSEAATLMYLGGSYSELGNFHKAIEISEQALVISREINDSACEAVSLNQLG